LVFFFLYEKIKFANFSNKGIEIKSKMESERDMKEEERNHLAFFS